MARRKSGSLVKKLMKHKLLLGIGAVVVGFMWWKKRQAALPPPSPIILPGYEPTPTAAGLENYVTPEDVSGLGYDVDTGASAFGQAFDVDEGASAFGAAARADVAYDDTF